MWSSPRPRVVRGKVWLAEVVEGGGGGRRRGGIPVHAALARPCLLYLQAHGSELAPSAAVGFVAEVLERVFFAADEALDG